MGRSLLSWVLSPGLSPGSRSGGAYLEPPMVVRLVVAAVGLSERAPRSDDVLLACEVGSMGLQGLRFS